jgi:hypothetical protein
MGKSSGKKTREYAIVKQKAKDKRQKTKDKRQKIKGKSKKEKGKSNWENWGCK